MQGWRKSLEEKVLVEIFQANNEEYAVFCIFDGHGGPAVADYLQANFKKYLVNSLSEIEDKEEAIRDAFKTVNRALKKETNQNNSSAPLTEEEKLFEELFEPEKANSFKFAFTTGSCAIVALFHNNTIHLANIGDSKGYLISDKRKIRLNYLHKPDFEEESKRIMSEGFTLTQGRIEGNINISRAFGDFLYEGAIIADPSISTQKVNSGDILVLASDGVLDSFDDLDADKFHSVFALQEESIKVLLDTLAKDPSSSIGKDNASIVVVRFK